MRIYSPLLACIAVFQFSGSMYNQFILVDWEERDIRNIQFWAPHIPVHNRQTRSQPLSCRHLLKTVYFTLQSITPVLKFVEQGQTEHLYVGLWGSMGSDVWKKVLTTFKQYKQSVEGFIDGIAFLCTEH